MAATPSRPRPRRDQPRRWEVAWALIIILTASASGRLLPPPPLGELSRAGDALSQWSRERVAALEEVWARVRRSCGLGRARVQA